MIRQVTGAGATGLLLLQYCITPASPRHMAAQIWNRTPACAWQVRAWCISVLISPNTD